MGNGGGCVSCRGDVDRVQVIGREIMGKPTGGGVRKGIEDEGEEGAVTVGEKIQWSVADDTLRSLYPVQVVTVLLAGDRQRGLDLLRTAVLGQRTKRARSLDVTDVAPLVSPRRFAPRRGVYTPQRLRNRVQRAVMVDDDDDDDDELIVLNGRERHTGEVVLVEEGRQAAGGVGRRQRRESIVIVDLDSDSEQAASTSHPAAPTGLLSLELNDNALFLDGTE